MQSLRIFLKAHKKDEKKINFQNISIWILKDTSQAAEYKINEIFDY